MANNLCAQVTTSECRFYGIPRGGVSAALLIAQYTSGIVVDSPAEATHIVDDIIDSGRTRSLFAERFPDKPFLALIDKQAKPDPDWIVFPWETSNELSGAEDNVRRVLQAIGENPDREGLLETPKRFLKALREFTRGLHEDPKVHLAKSFTLDEAQEGLSYDEMIISRHIPFTSVCEHHLLPFTGHAYIGYVPKKEDCKVVGLSKLARLVEGYACRLQVQERLTTQIASAIVEVLDPLGVGVILEAKHTCQCMRGVKKDGTMVTSSLRGAMHEGPARSEFLTLCRLGQS